MPYVGNSPASNFASVTKDTFSGDGSTTAFTLSKAATTNGVAVFVENVRQEPTTAYAVSGTTLTFTAAPVSASGNNIYVLHHNTPASTATHPSAQALTATSGTFTGAFTSVGIDDNADATSITIDSSENVGIKTTTPTNYYADDLVVTAPDEGGITVVGGTTERNYLAFADGTSGDAQYRGLISYDHNTDILGIGAGGGTKIQLDGNGHMTNSTQPCFLVRNSSDQSNISLATLVTVVFDTEVFDQNADFASNTFTAPVTGRYLFTYNLNFSQTDADHNVLQITLSTSNNAFTNNPAIDPSAFTGDPSIHAMGGAVICDMDANDTALVKMSCEGGSAQTDIVSNGVRTNFGGVLLC